MRKLQNILYITTQGSYLHKERETLVVEQERKKVAQLPVHSIGHIFCFGNVLVSPFLLGFCGENNVNLAFFTENGCYLGRLQGRQNGNVLLRRAQYRVSEQSPMPIACNIIAAKIRAIRKRARACALSGQCMFWRISWASAAYWIWWKRIQKQAV
ncbi:CRISPR-associated endonuclease Cas1 [Neisseria gonorrhoeae]